MRQFHKLLTAIIVIAVVTILIVFMHPWQDDNSVSNLYIFPAGTFTLDGSAGPAPTTTPAAATPLQKTGDYCFVQEVHPDYLGDSFIVRLTDGDLDDFPLYGKYILNPGNFSGTWINGHRTAGDFTDYDHRFSDFRNLSCRNYSWVDCPVHESGVVYEYGERYFEVGCLPDFGGAHRSRDG